MKKPNPTNGSLSTIKHTGQDAIHNLTDHVRSTASKSRRILDVRHRNDVLRELGRLHYDAHRTGDEPDQVSIDRLTDQLDADLPDDADE